MDAFQWTCPYCDRDTTITASNANLDHFELSISARDGYRYFSTFLIVCPNKKCRHFALEITMHSYSFVQGRGWQIGKELQSWTLLPPSAAKAFPEYVPKPIREDYVEACLIRDKSPKASATLSRRCLQGMIRDFWGIKGKRLKDEIDALEEKVDGLTWKAIDGVRKIGNIGAHMEQDINVIVDVESNEAQLLIGLIEILVKDW